MTDTDVPSQLPGGRAIAAELLRKARRHAVYTGYGTEPLGVQEQAVLEDALENYIALQEAWRAAREFIAP